MCFGIATERTNGHLQGDSFLELFAHSEKTPDSESLLLFKGSMRPADWGQQIAGQEAMRGLESFQL